jgi:arginase family enzyme
LSLECRAWRPTPWTAARRVAAARGRANPYAAPGGPSLADVLAGLDAVLGRFEVAAAALTAYDPRVDGDGAIAAAARLIAARIARSVRSRSPQDG